jgi:hypothetical protein
VTSFLPKFSILKKKTIWRYFANKRNTVPRMAHYKSHLLHSTFVCSPHGKSRNTFWEHARNMRPMIAQLYGHWISLKFSTIVDLCIFYSKQHHWFLAMLDSYPNYIEILEEALCTCCDQYCIVKKIWYHY